MKTVKILGLMAAFCLLFSAVSCTKTNGNDNAGIYGVEPSITVSNSDYAILTSMEEAIREALPGSTIFRTSANDNKVIAACDKVYAAYKNTGTTAFTITVYWQESNVVGKPENPKVKIKDYAIAALD